MNLNGARVVVTGSTGMIGRHVVKRLKMEGCGKIVEIDRGLWEGLPMFLQTFTDCVFHCAGITTGVHHSAKHPASQMMESLSIDLKFFEAIGSNISGVGKVIALGCGCAYPGSAKQPYREEDYGRGWPDGDHKYFGVAKQAVWSLAKAFHREYGLITHVLIPSNVYGPWDNFDPESSHVVAALIRNNWEACVNNDQYVHIWGSGLQRRNFIHARDVADAMVEMTKTNHDQCEILNICGRDGDITIHQLAEEIQKHSARDILPCLEGPTGDLKREFNGSLALSVLAPWEPMVNISEGIRETWEWYCAERGKTS